MSSISGVTTVLDVLDEVEHPTRLRVLVTVASGDPLSPNGYSKVFDENLGVVAYHFRKLESQGLITLDREEPVRGAVEHFYRASGPGRELVRRLLGALR